MIIDQIDVNAFKNSNTEVRSQVFNADGNPYPIPGATFKLTAKARPFDDDDEAYVVKSSANGDFLIIDANNGIFRTEILPQDLADVPPGEYSYDIQMTLSDGKKYSIQRGRFVVLTSVTGS